MEGKNPHAHKQEILSRMKGTIDHTRLVRAMVEEGCDCSEVLIQLSSVKDDVSGISRTILKEYIHDCLREAVQNQDQEKIRELNRMIEVFMK